MLRIMHLDETSIASNHMPSRIRMMHLLNTYYVAPPFSSPRDRIHARIYAAASHLFPQKHILPRDTSTEARV